MTKEEVRTVVLSKLRPENNSIVYDIGAGTGSLTVEAANLASQGIVYAIEKNEKGIELIEKNREKFELKNIKVIKGEAPQSLSDLPRVDRIIIGGSGGNLDSILETAKKKLKDTGRIVITAVTLETLFQAKKHLEKLNFKYEICNITVTRTRQIADYHMLKGMNPVFIISADRGGYR